MNYQQIVDEARELVADIERVEPKQWRLAELCYLAIEETGNAGEFADAIGKTARYVSVLRRVWVSYGQSSSREDLPADSSFNDVYQLTTMSPERAEAVRLVAEEQGLGIGRTAYGRGDETRAVREALVDAPADPEVRKQIAREVLQTPAEAREVLSDIRTGAATSRAQRELDEQTRANSRERVRQHAPAALNLKGFLLARREWADASTAVRHGLKELEGVELSPVERDTLDEQLALLERWVAVARQRLAGHSLDAELAELLSQEN